KPADRRFARQVSEIYQTDHHEHVTSYREVAGSLDAVLEAFDEPFAGVTSTYLLSALIARHVKVALSGDGADELFASYLPHRLAQPLASYAVFRQTGNAALIRPFEDRAAYLSELLSDGATGGAPNDWMWRAKLLV